MISRVVKKLRLQPWIPREWDEQRAIMAWAGAMEPRYPMLKLLHASMNGAAMKSPKQAVTAKLAGMRNGVPDLCLPWPVGKGADYNGPVPFMWYGLWLEIKRRDQRHKLDGGLSVDQRWWLEELAKAGYQAWAVYGASEGIAAIKKYLKIRD